MEILREIVPVGNGSRDTDGKDDQSAAHSEAVQQAKLRHVGEEEKRLKKGKGEASFSWGA